MTNGLLLCPVCSQNGQRTVLGSITVEGYFTVMRFRLGNGVTIIKATTYEVMCLCGFGTVVDNTANGHSPLQALEM